MTSRVTSVLIALVIIGEHFWQSSGQDAILPTLPLGRFGFLGSFPGGGFPLAVATNASTVFNAFVDRPRLDTSVPTGVNAAAVAAQGDAILAFIRSCPGQMVLAGLRCPCAHPGGRCADLYSVCTLENKCACNGKLAYPDPSGQRCIPYVIRLGSGQTEGLDRKKPLHRTTTLPTTTTTRTTTTTTTPTTTTLPVTTTTTTRTTTTTTMTTTTTLPPNTFADCATNTDPANPTTRTLGLADTYTIISTNYPSTSTKIGVSCRYAFIPPLGKQINYQFVELDIDHADAGGACLSLLSLDASGQINYCNSHPPSPNFAYPSFAPDRATHLGIFIDPTITKPYKFKVIVSVK